MKIMNPIFTLVVAALTATTVLAQKKETNYPDSGTWVIESNTKAPKLQTVKFYNARQQLIYEETRYGKKINISKARIRAKLNNLLVKLMEKDKLEAKKNVVAAAPKK